MSDYFVTPLTVACQAPLSMGFSQAKILEWVAIPFSRGVFLTQGSNQCLLLDRQILYHWVTWETFFFFALGYYINEASHINWHCLLVIISMNGKKRCHIQMIQRKMPQETWVFSGMNARENSTLIMVINKATSTIYFIKALVNVF